MPASPREASAACSGSRWRGQCPARPRRAWEGNASPSPAEGAGPRGRDQDAGGGQAGSFRLGPGVPRASSSGPDARGSHSGGRTAGCCSLGRSRVSRGCRLHADAERDPSVPQGLPDRRQGGKGCPWFPEHARLRSSQVRLALPPGFYAPSVIAQGPRISLSRAVVKLGFL